MIFEGIVRLVVGLLVGIVKGLGALVPDVPGWVVRASGGLQTVAEYGSKLSAWVPFPFVLGVLGTVLACMAAGLLIKVARIVASFLTAGGGSAA